MGLAHGTVAVLVNTGGKTDASDELVATNKALPLGAIGDLKNVWFGQRIYPIFHTIEDGPRCFLKDGKVFISVREIQRFHETDVVAALEAQQVYL